MVKNCDNCINSGRPSYEWPCNACETAYVSAPSKWEGMVPVTADMVEVVRCKDCKMEYGCRVAQWLGENGFCSYGERRTDV